MFYFCLEILILVHVFTHDCKCTVRNIDLCRYCRTPNLNKYPGQFRADHSDPSRSVMAACGLAHVMIDQGFGKKYNEMVLHIPVVQNETLLVSGYSYDVEVWLKQQRGKINAVLSKGLQGGTGELEKKKERDCSAEVLHHSSRADRVQCTWVRSQSAARADTEGFFCNQNKNCASASPSKLSMCSNSNDQHITSSNKHFTTIKKNK